MDPVDRQYYRLHPEAAYLRDVGYVFIDLRGRTVRMQESEFDALRAQSAAGELTATSLSQQGLLVPCLSAAETDASFRLQELTTHAIA